MKKIYLTASLLLLATLCFAQTTKKDSLKKDTLIVLKNNILPPVANTNKYTPNVTLPSPHAATLGEYGNTPINLSSGLATPNISFFDLKEGDIGFGVGISYQYKGFKPFESPSLLGRGWALNSGGVITRVIKSKPDERRPASPIGSNYGYANTENRTQLADLINNDGTIAGLGGGNSVFYSFPDGEPDIFIFNFMNMTGKFFFGEDGAIHVVSDRKLKIEYRTVTLTQTVPNDPNMDKTHFVEFTITDENGTVYKFGDTSASVALPIKNVEFSTAGSDFDCILGGGSMSVTSWYVAKITDKNGREINFNYTNDYMYQSGNDKYFNFPLRGRSVNSPVARGQYQTSSQTYSHDNMWSCVGSMENFLTSVNGTNWTVDFEYNKTGNVTYLTKTTLKSNLVPKEDIKKFTFNFLNLTNADGLLLSTVTESSPDNAINKLHTFTYHDATNLNYNNFYGIDYWGYDNGAFTNTTLIADSPFNANRSPNFSTTLKGALTKITYPTAGSTEFTYEQNEYGQLRESEYENGSLINKKPYGGIRVKTIIDKDLDGTVLIQKDYGYNSFANANKSSGVISSSIGLTKLRYLLDKPAYIEPNSPFFPVLPNKDKYYSEGLHSIAEMPIYYTNVTETLSDGATTKSSFTSHNDYNDFLGVNFGWGNNQIGSPASYLLMRSLPKEIKHYKNNVLVKEKINTYNLVDRHKARSLYTGSSTAGNAISQTTDFLKTYYTYSGWLQKTAETERLYSDATNFIETVSTNNYNNTTYLQVSSMTTQSSKGETLSMEYKYPYDFTVEPYLTMVNKNIIAPVIEETSFLNTTQTTSKITDYATFGTLQLPEKIRTKIGNGTEITQVVFDTYDTRGNLTKYTSRSGQSSTMQYFGTTDYGKTDLLRMQTIGGGSTGTELSRDTEYEYLPLVGLQFTDDINGYRTSFQYDVFSRLKSVKDHKNYLLKDNDYHYANQTALSGLGITPTNAMNYVVNRTARTEQTGTTLSSDVDNTTTQLQYMDGLGRAVQSLVWKGTPDKTKDIITGTTQFDGNSRAYKSILPTPSDVVTGAYKSTAQTLASTFYGDTYPYTETVFEPSPLNRPIKQFGAGQAWRVAGNEKFTEINYLIAGTEVIQFNVQANGTVDGSTNYPASSLYNNRIISERGFWTIELKDKQGRVTHKFQQLQAGFTFAITAYVYSDLGFLVYTIPPEAYQKFGTGVGQITSFTEADDIFKELCFGYHYDNLGRLSEKKMPGASWKYSIFDKHDREVAFADEADRAKGYWHFRKFDALGREIYGGILNGKGSTDRATLQTAFDGFTGQAYETAGSDLYNYTNVSFPTTYAPVDADVMSVNYYDNYFGWQGDTNYDFQETNAFHLQGFSKGLLTGQLKRNIKTNTWQRMVLYYDYRGKLIQDFHLTNLNSLIRKDHQYRFNGELLKTRITKGSVIKTFCYDYDHIGRKSKFKHGKNGIEKTVSTYLYDAVGRLTSKFYAPVYQSGSKQSGPWTDPNTWSSNSVPTQNDLATINNGHTVTIPYSTTVSAGGLIFQNGVLENLGTLKLGNFGSGLGNLQKNLNANAGEVSGYLHASIYQYKIRGGLKGVNLDANNDLTNNLFSYKLFYEDDQTLFDGNIKKQSWQSNYDGKQRSFEFSYDGASRLKSATFTSTQAGENFSLNNVDYDKNGNITALSRNGWKSNNSYGLIDNLAYSYNATSNKILKVDDASNETASFRDVSGDDYEYWLDGSLKKDNNKDITQIDYNYLKLPQKINLTGGRWIEYEYDAGGTKLKKTLSTGKYIDYEEDEIFENGALYQTGHDEGRIVNDVYEYNIFDHLGNLRVAFKDNNGIPEVVQYQNHGAWGESLENINYSKPIDNKFTFSTYEKEDDFGINVFDAHARVFDSTVPRFWSHDVMSEKFSSYSPYHFSGNNPIMNIDPDGQDWFRHNETGSLIWKDSQAGDITVNDQVFNNVGARFAWTSSISNGNGGTQTVLNIGAADGTTTLITPNEYNVVQFPETGNGFARYTGGMVDTYKLNGVSGQWGDNWVNPETGASLYNTIQQFHKQEPGITIHYGDISAYKPSIDLGHDTHTQGNAIDIRYIDPSGNELQGDNSYSKADVCTINCFMSKAESNGFSNNYSYGRRFTHAGQTNNSVHKNHFHIAKPNR
jgi:RHS repeat-associated protein